MSKEHQKYEQQSLKFQKQYIQGMINANCFANSMYYSFPMNQSNYYYNYMYPYANSPCLPFYPPPYIPPTETSSSKSDMTLAKIEEKEETIIKHACIKFETDQQKNFHIKMQQSIPVVKQFFKPIEALKGTQKANKKQLYIVELAENFPKNRQEDITELLFKFKKVIKDHLEDVQNEKIDLNIYEPQFAKYLNEDRPFFEELMISLAQRFKQYKKTKEQLIKLIIRRTYHNLKIHKKIICEKPEYERLQAFHQKNLATFKSMNVQFLKREFSNQLFVHLFKEFMVNFQELFEKENNQKIQRFSCILASCWFEKSTKLLMHERKLPWANAYKYRILKIASDLLQEYGGSTTADDEPKK